jgi:hypothetical protein
VLGSFISSLYRTNVADELAGQVDQSVIDTAKEGVGVLAGQTGSLPADVAQTAFAGAGDAFVHAMNSGFWLSAAVLATGAVVALWLLPDEVREDQVVRDGADPVDADESQAADEPTDAHDLVVDVTERILEPTP